MSDYYIGVNQNGEPYIAHAWGQRGPNQSHKYIAKIGEGIKARYFYTPEELRAFQMGGRQKAQNAVNAAKQKTANVANKVKEKASDTAGRIRENSTLLNVGNQYRAAQRAHQNSKSSDPETAKWGKKGYDDNNTLGGKAYKAQQRVKDFVEEQKSKDTAENLFKKKYGVEPKKAHETIIETPGDKFVKETKEKLKSTSDRMKEEFRKKSGATAKEEYEKAKAESVQAAKDYVKTRRTATENDERFGQSELDATRKLNDKNYNEYDKRREYDDTPLGKIDNAVNRLKGVDSKARNDSEQQPANTTNAKLVKKMNSDWDRHELEIASNRGPIDLDHVSKEYMYALGSNTGHAGSVSKVMEQEEAFRTARNAYRSLLKNKEAASTDISKAKREMEKLEKEYNSGMEKLAKELNKDVEEAKKKLKENK